MGIQHTQVIINNFGEERFADWDDHHYGERSDNGDCDCLTSVHTHDEKHTKAPSNAGPVPMYCQLTFQAHDEVLINVPSSWPN